MHNKLRLRLLKIQHELEGERQKIKIDKDLFIEKMGKDTRINKAIGKRLKDFQTAINQLNGKIRTLKQWLAT
jgi:hypothetical protein